jgi:cytochrome-b5 reductase
MRVTRDELGKHNSRDDCWTSVRGHVYNITAFFKYHPGGEEILDQAAGTDATELFEKYHTWVSAEAILKHCFIGYLVGPGSLW